MAFLAERIAPADPSSVFSVQCETWWLEIYSLVPVPPAVRRRGPVAAAIALPCALVRASMRKGAHAPARPLAGHGSRAVVLERALGDRAFHQHRRADVVATNGDPEPN